MITLMVHPQRYAWLKAWLAPSATPAADMARFAGLTVVQNPWLPLAAAVRRRCVWGRRPRPWSYRRQYAIVEEPVLGWLVDDDGARSAVAFKWKEFLAMDNRKYRVEMWNDERGYWMLTWWCSPSGVQRHLAEDALRQAQQYAPKRKYRVQEVTGDVRPG